jgi:allantoinase
MAHAIRSTCIVRPDGPTPATLIVEGGKIAEVRPWVDARDFISLTDFGDLAVLPGLVDTHVHINEPGRAEWEGFASATRAAAAGGVTTLVDMPLNCAPETTSVAALEAKRFAAFGDSWVDWATWGGVVRGNSSAIDPLIQAGVRGFKCFLIHSGIDGFPWVEENDLRKSLETLRPSGLPLLAHAELPRPIDRAAEELRAQGADWKSYPTYLRSRPDEAEISAIALLIRLADEFRTPVHVVHLSSAGALPLLKDARSRGVPITVETCPHYLWFAAEEIPDGATEFKCAPPIRGKANRDALWRALDEGLIDMVATDHSPCLPKMKQRPEGRWDLAWGGIASLGLALPIMWTGMAQRGVSIDDGLKRIAALLAAKPAQLAGMEGVKGTISPGCDADFAVFDPSEAWKVSEADLRFRHSVSPYLGVELRGRVRETWLRGEPVFSQKGFAGMPRGKEWVKP